MDESKQQYAIESLREENRVLRTPLGSCRLRWTDDQRRSLAAKAKLVGRKLLGELASSQHRTELEKTTWKEFLT
jgi:hypothetical protein